MPRRLLRRTKDVLHLLVRGHPSIVLRAAIGTRLRSEAVSFGLRRDLTVPHAAPPAKIPLVVRPLAPGDDLSMLDIDRPGLEGGAAYSRLAQRRLIQANLPTCWVAIAPNGKPCYMQWLIAPKDNERLDRQWGDLFPSLGSDEALLEGAYTDDAYRGQGIMAHAMTHIAAEGRAFGARWVITFVGETNIASLKGCKKAGFLPYVKRAESWWLLRRRIRFTPLPEGTPYPFD